MKVKVKWRVAKYGDPYSELVLSAFNTSKCTHTVLNTHPEQWAAILLRRPGSSWGFGALLKGLTTVMVLKVEESAGYSLPPLTIPKDQVSTDAVWKLKNKVHKMKFIFWILRRLAFTALVIYLLHVQIGGWG